MSRDAHPEAMAPPRPGPTRTAPPQLPDQFPTGGRYLSYTLFGATGFLYLLLGWFVLGAVRALGAGPEQWQHVLATWRHPVYVVFHLISLASVVFVGVRFFGLFPKAQPPRIGPAKPPPQPVILAMLYAVWIGVTVVLSAVLAGALFR